MTLPFNLKQLRILKAIASEKNFTKAGYLLFISQPTLSKQIKILENQLGILLINREKNKIQLTESGKIFLNYSERILSLCEESCRTLNNIKNNCQKDIIIGTDEIIGNFIMPYILTLFIKNYPQFNIKIHINYPKIITQKLINKKINIAILTNTFSNKQNKKIDIKNLIDDELIPIRSKYNLLQKKYTSVILFNQLYNINLIEFASTIKIYKLAQKHLQNKHTIKKFKNILKLNSIVATKIAINLGFGFSFISTKNINERELKLIKLFKIKNVRLKRNIYLLTKHENNNSKSVKFFIHKLYKLKINKEILSRSKIFDQ